MPIYLFFIDLQIHFKNVCIFILRDTFRVLVIHTGLHMVLLCDV